MKTLKVACKDLIFNAEVVDTSETPTNTDIENLLDSVAECREIIKQLESKEKTFIFLTIDGTTYDGTGEDVENCQMLAIAKGTDALTAYNNMLLDRSWTGYFDTCFAYELASENINSFDLINDEDDEVCHCNKCDKAIGLSDFEIGDGKCVECNNQ